MRALCVLILVGCGSGYAGPLPPEKIGDPQCSASPSDPRVKVPGHRCCTQWMVRQDGKVAARIECYSPESGPGGEFLWGGDFVEDGK